MHATQRGVLIDNVTAFKVIPYDYDGQNALSGRDMAAQLQISEAKLRVSVFRFKKRLGEILLEEVAQTVADGENIDDELNRLVTALQLPA